eukprot:TRINITY_DN60989_c0_g1_i1.p1 TRINITY_DN60989_c0_g1~~TRINITY_DN60989_c0_g1_i1.p1  ORF type:complete len:266 (+),score=61.32 TRINITY_DN60989_c0_g1_i1:61-858(+)
MELSNGAAGGTLLGGSSSAGASSSSTAAPTPPRQSSRKILYALVAKDSERVLAECVGLQFSSGRGALAANFKEACGTTLQKLDRATEGKSYLQGDHAFHFLSDQASELWFVCIADADMGRRQPYGFLEELKEEFLSQGYTASQLGSSELGFFQRDFEAKLSNVIEKFNDPNADRIAGIKEKVKNINDTLTEGIEKILERSEKIELLVEKSQVLMNDSVSFRTAARDVHRQAWWRNAKMIACLVFAIILVILILLVGTCGITLSHC